MDLESSPQKAAHNMLQQARRLLFNQLQNHIAEDSTNSIESLVSGTNIVEAVVVQEYFLNNEYGNRFAQLRPGFHDPKAQWNDLSREEEVDDIGRVILDQCSNDA